jgi:beta-lactamase superfamily II metal-dependent hydrolase
MDHIGGLVDVLKIFDVGVFLESGGQSENNAQDTLESKLKEKNIKRKITSRGEEYNLGKGVYLTTLYPYYDVSNTESNTGSLIMQLELRRTHFFTYR